MELAVHPWLVLLFTMVLGGGITLLLIPIARRWGWVDRPDGHKIHDGPTPLVGGVAIFLSISTGLSLTGFLNTLVDPFVVALMLGALLMLISGAVDDIKTVSPIMRLLVQALTCLVMAYYGGARLHDFGELFSGSVLELGWLSLPVTLFAALGVINAFNMIDGMDGLAGSIFVVAALGILGLSASHGLVTVAWILAITTAAVSGFLLCNARLPWNPKARAFMGDAGSMMLGFLLAWSFIRLGGESGRAFMPMTAVWLFAVPLLDTSTLIWMRLREGRSAFDADQRHLHHACLRAGFSVGQAWLLITMLAVTLAFLGIGFELSQLPEYFSFYAFLVVAFTYYFYAKSSWSRQRFLGRHFIHHDFEIEEDYR